MRNKRVFMTVAIIAMVVLLGVGYAETTGKYELNVIGTLDAKFDESAYAVEFDVDNISNTDNSITGKTDTVKLSDEDDGKNRIIEIECSFGMDNMNVTKTITIPIKSKIVKGLNARLDFEIKGSDNNSFSSSNYSVVGKLQDPITPTTYRGQSTPITLTPTNNSSALQLEISLKGGAHISSTENELKEGFTVILNVTPINV